VKDIYLLRYSRRLRCAWISSFALLCTLMAATSWAQDSAKPQLSKEDTRSVLEAIRLSHKLPGLGAAVVTDEGLQLLATTGVRKQGDETPVTDEDLWHLGSCGKAMIARLVEAEKMSYQQTMGDTFPKLATKMSDQMKAIKLIDLLSHTSGLPANFNLQNYVGEKSTSRARRNVLREAIDTELLSVPGEQFLYSNWGYTLAGHMAETVTGKSWESLVRTEVFKPLELSTAGFGGTGKRGKIDQPWPHFATGKPAPNNGKAMDNMPVMGPAGTIHMALKDWGKFISAHLKGHRGESSYLTQASFQELHTAIKDDYALGWVTQSKTWAGGTALFHNGDNTMNHAIVWAAPEKQFAVLVVTNQSGAGQAADEVASELIELWQEGPPLKAKVGQTK
jgi:CubicO group peptidase (beta-lactamase class C family)